MRCSNGTLVSRRFLSLPPQWRQLQPRNPIREEEEEEERRPRTRLQRLTQHPPLTRRPLRTWRRTFPRHGLRRTSRHRELRRTSPLLAPRRTSLLLARRHTSPHRARRPMLRRSGLPVQPARPAWRGMRRRREPLRLARSDSRKSMAAMSAAAADRGSPNLVRAKIWGGSPDRAALSPPRRAAAASPLHNKTPLRDRA